MRLLAAVKARVAAGHARFHVPGHKGSRKHSEALRDLISENTALSDLTEVPGLDNLHSAEGAIAEAQEAASTAFGAANTHFLVNGTTGGILAVISACCGPHATLVTSRASHVSVFNAAATAGCDVALIDPEIDAIFGVPLPLTAEDVLEALGCVQQRVGAVLVTCPTYEGLCSDLQAIARVCHSRGIPLIVDEAHGAHLGLHPSFPPSAMQCGADFAVQSTHKTLGSLTQSAMLHVHAHAPPRATAALPRFLRMFQSSSPSYLLLCSLDAAADVARSGPHAWDDALRAATHVRHAWRASGGRLLCDVYQSSDATTNGTDIYDENEDQQEYGTQIRTDPLRVTLLATDHDMSGYQCAEKLERHGLAPEMATHACVVLALGIGSKLVDSVRAAGAFQKVLRTSTMLDAYNSPITHDDMPTARPNNSHGRYALCKKAKRRSGSNMHDTGHEPRKSKQTASSKRQKSRDNVPQHQNPSSGGSQRPKIEEVDSAVVTLATQQFDAQSLKSRSTTRYKNTNNSTYFGPAGAEIAARTDRVTLVRGIREAAMGVVEKKCWEEVLQRGGVCGGLVSVYPPGVPVLVYGEEITEEAIDVLQESVEAGGRLVGCSEDLCDIPVVVL